MIKLAIIDGSSYNNFLYVEDENERLVRTLEITNSQVAELSKLHVKGRLHLMRLQEKNND